MLAARLTHVRQPRAFDVLVAVVVCPVRSVGLEIRRGVCGAETHEKPGNRDAPREPSAVRPNGTNNSLCLALWALTG